MNRKALPIILLFCSCMSNCASMSMAEKCAMTGAVGGGIIGAYLDEEKGAAIGAVAGAAAGMIIGSYIDDRISSRDEAARKYEYASQSEKLIVENAYAKPLQVSQGGELRMSVQYTVLLPAGQEKTTIFESRKISRGNDVFDLGSRKVERTQGTYLSSLNVSLPRDLEKGDYSIVTVISNGSGRKSACNIITVT